MIQWNDTTPYSRHASIKVPTVWTAKAGQIYLSIVWNHIHHPDRWVMNCFDLKMESYPIASTEKEGAQQEAIRLVRARLEGYLARLNAADAV